MICEVAAGAAALEERHRPALEGLGQQRVVGVAEGAGGDLPGRSQDSPALVDEDAHQLGHGDGGVRVVELDGDLVGKLVEVGVGLLVAADDVGDGAGDEEVLLLEAQLAPGPGAVVRGRAPWRWSRDAFSSTART
jgi:hypothetical protein